MGCSCRPISRRGKTSKLIVSGPSGNHWRFPAVQFCDYLTTRIVVWLAAVLVPAGSLPAMTCSCGSHADSSQADGCRLEPESAGPPSCCGERAKPTHSCCQSRSAPATARCCLAGSSCSCCGNGGTDSNGNGCQCSAGHSSVPAPDPEPRNPRTDETKPSLSAACFGNAAAATVAAAPAILRADQQSMNLGSTAPERLSVLCRLVL